MISATFLFLLVWFYSCCSSDSLADLLWRTLDSPAPLPLGRSIVHVRAALHDVQLQYPASADQPPLADVRSPLSFEYLEMLCLNGEIRLQLYFDVVAQINFRVLFRLLEPKVIIEIFNAMLCEVSVLLLADSVDELTPCLEALNVLLHPMKWPFVYVPVLPLSLVGMFCAIVCIAARVFASPRARRFSSLILFPLVVTRHCFRMQSCLTHRKHSFLAR